MSHTSQTPARQSKANQRSRAQIIAQQARPGQGGRHGPGGMGRVGEKAMNFWPSLKRLLRELGPQRVMLMIVILMVAASVVAAIFAPKVMIHATNEMFAGFISNKIIHGAACMGNPLPPGTKMGDLVTMLQQMPANGASSDAMKACFGASGGSGSVDLGSMSKMISGMDPNRLVAGIDFGVIGHWLLLVGALYGASALLMFVQGLLLARIVQRTVYQLREKISAKLERLPLKYFDGQPRGEILSRVTNDIDNIQQSLQQTISQVLNALLTVIGVAIMMFTVSWELALITIAIVPVAAVVSGLIGKRAQGRFVGMWMHTGELNGQVEEGFTGHAIVKVFGRRQEVDARFKETNEQLFRSAFGAHFLSTMLMPLNMFIGNINYVAVILVGALKVTSGTLQLGDVTSFIQYSRQFTQPISQIASMANLLQSGVASAERVFEVLDEPQQTTGSFRTTTVRADGTWRVPTPGVLAGDRVIVKKKAAGSPTSTARTNRLTVLAAGASKVPAKAFVNSVTAGQPMVTGTGQPGEQVKVSFPDERATLPTPVRGQVQFRNVFFSYTPDQPLIGRLNLEAEPGQTVAIVGETGAGKTTLVNLLMRFYDIQSGQILFDGVDTSTVPRDVLREQFGMVLQDTWLFSGTIKANIAYGAQGATDEQVFEAAKAAYVDRFVHALPDGYDTVIDDEGSNISTGEKQLLTIARAFVADPAVLILDEATSSVDTRTEVLVQQAMAKLRRGRTSFVIAHRLSTIRDADTIVVMAHGQIVEQGNHDELLARDGAYAKLYKSQFAAAGSLDDIDGADDVPQTTEAHAPMAG